MKAVIEIIGSDVCRFLVFPRFLACIGVLYITYYSSSVYYAFPYGGKDVTKSSEKEKSLTLLSNS
jgi:hypothetical protein